ncbi:MAG: type II CAAX endopeptidase family protein [Halobacteria archaeon]|nr:type II CAAX endopeptidase family protein [Halobacteria archaeon]
MNQSYRLKASETFSAVMVAVSAFLIGTAVTAFTGLFLRSVGVGLESTTVRLGLSVVLLQGVSFGGVAYIYLRLRGLGLGFIEARVPSLRDIGWVIAGFFAFLVSVMAISLLLNSLGIESATNRIQSVGENDPEVFLLLVPLSFLLIGPGEELLFRGVIQGVLRKTFDAAPAVGIASLIFSVGHASSIQGGLEGKLVYLGVVFVLSLILGGLYERTSNLVVPALIHGAYNAMLFLGMYVASTRNIEMAVSVV